MQAAPVDPAPPQARLQAFRADTGTRVCPCQPLALVCAAVEWGGIHSRPHLLDCLACCWGPLLQRSAHALVNVGREGRCRSRVNNLAMGVAGIVPSAAWYACCGTQASCCTLHAVLPGFLRHCCVRLGVVGCAVAAILIRLVRWLTVLHNHPGVYMCRVLNRRLCSSTFTGSVCWPPAAIWHVAWAAGGTSCCCMQQAGQGPGSLGLTSPVLTAL